MDHEKKFTETTEKKQYLLPTRDLERIAKKNLVRILLNSVKSAKEKARESKVSIKESFQQNLDKLEAKDFYNN